VAALRENGDASATSDAEFSQAAGESIDSVAELLICEPDVAADRGFAIGKLGAGAVEQVSNRSAGL
jgi:hypothetical protein